MDNKTLYEEKLVVPMTTDAKACLKKIAKERSTSMNQLIREGIILIIKKYQKKN